MRYSQPAMPSRTSLRTMLSSFGISLSSMKNGPSMSVGRQHAARGVVEHRALALYRCTGAGVVPASICAAMPPASSMTACGVPALPLRSRASPPLPASRAALPAAVCAHAPTRCSCSPLPLVLAPPLRACWCRAALAPPLPARSASARVIALVGSAAATERRQRRCGHRKRAEALEQLAAQQHRARRSARAVA